MPLLTLADASLAYGDAPLLERAELTLENGERVALIGRNGTGKTSLLRVVAGRQTLDSGTIWRAPGLRIGFVPQEPELDRGHTVFEAVAAGAGEVQSALVEYHALSHQLEAHADADELARLQELQHALEHADGWRINSRIKALIDRFKLPADTPVGQLSGGIRKRVALAQALAVDPELLLLDEPTNHLDIAAIEWLEGVIAEHRGCVLLVTHDRRFLDNVATRILELDRGRLASFAGSYAEYQRRKEEMLNAETIANARFDKLLAQEETWIRKGIEARRTRNEGRVRRLQDLRRARAARRDRVGTVNLDIAAGDRSGDMIVEMMNVTKKFGEVPVIRDFSTRVVRGDKVGLVGPNGSGKTTLLKLILGEIEPDAGRIRRGARINVAYYDQLREQLDDDATVADTISPGADWIEIGGAKKHVMSYLGDFLFPPARARSKVSALSGGERNRLLLARLFSRPANVLVLDEPTNDLDLETLELLEALLQDYTGTLFLVSHDRAFLDNVVTQVIAFEGDAVLREYAGGYSDWVRVRPSVVAPQPELQRNTAKPVPPTRPAAARAPAAKLSYKESRELESLPSRIAELEREQSAISADLADPAVYREAPDRVQSLRDRYAAIEDELMRSLTRWEELEQRTPSDAPGRTPGA